MLVYKKIKYVQSKGLNNLYDLYDYIFYHSMKSYAIICDYRILTYYIYIE